MASSTASNAPTHLAGTSAASTAPASVQAPLSTHQSDVGQLSTKSLLQLKGITVHFDAPLKYSLGVKVKSGNREGELRKLFDIKGNSPSPVNWVPENTVFVSLLADFSVTLQKKGILSALQRKKSVVSSLAIPAVSFEGLFEHDMSLDNKEFVFSEATVNLQKIQSVRVLVGPSQEFQEYVKLSLQEAANLAAQRKSLLEKMGKVGGFFSVLLKFGSLIGELHPAAKAAVAVFEVIHKKLKDQEETRKEIVDLLDSMTSMLPLTEFAMEAEADMKIKFTWKTVQAMLYSMEEVSRFTVKYFRTGFHTEESKKKVVEYKRKFRHLMDDFQQCTSQEVWKTVLQTDYNVWLNMLNSAPGAFYDPARACLEGTRVDVLGMVQDWAASEDPTVFWLHGAAGSGKTCVNFCGNDAEAESWWMLFLQKGFP